MKDALGNDLREGELVVLQLERPLVYGRISKIEEGGVITGVSGKGEAQLRPARVMIESRHVMEVDPRRLVAALLALRDDERPKDEKDALPN
jgi:hypothetical protein